MNYVKDIVPKFSQKAKPIYNTIKGNTLCWTEEAENALQNLKEAILGSGQLEGRDDSKSLEVDIDPNGYQPTARNEKVIYQFV